MRLLSVFAFVLAFSGFAAAQTPAPANPVIQHYRAYQAALTRNDLNAAAVEAEAALTASQQRDGDGGRTAVLALNLASVRLLNNNAAAAIEPAQQALRLAQSGASGVDARLAGLVLGRAELATAGQAGADRLNALLGASLDGVPPAEIYPAATELGAWAVSARNFDMSRSAWHRAAESADGSQYGQAYGSAVAKTGEGAAIILGEVGQGDHRIDRQRAIEADNLLREALLTLSPMVAAAPVTDAPTVAERAAAEASAWRSVIRVKLVTDQQTPLPANDQDNQAQAGPPADGQCSTDITHPDIQYPRSAQERSRIGVVVLRLRFTESGEIVAHTILASLGDPSFAQVIDRDSAHWRVTRSADAAPGCRMSGRRVVTINFTLS